MYIMYVDESGDTTSLSQGGKNYLVLLGCIIHESKVPIIDEAFRKIKKQYYQKPDIEIKSNHLRYANPDIAHGSPLKLHDRQQYNQLETDLTKFLTEAPVELISVVINKQDYWKKYPSQNPYRIAYMYLLERFQLYLKSRDNSLGICIIDPREGQVEKHYFGDEIHELHEQMRYTGRQDGNIWNACNNVVEKLLFSQSDKTVGIQLADLYSYPVFHIHEYNKVPEDYWRFNLITYPKLWRPQGLLAGKGFKYFPGDNKKALV